MSIIEVAQSLDLALIKNRRYQMFKTSALKGEGLEEAMDWYDFCVCVFYLINLFFIFNN